MNQPLNKYFDHTLLKPEAVPEEIRRLCSEAKNYGFYSVCVNSFYVKLAKTILEKSDVKVACVVGFPLGACATEVKEAETKYACQQGAEEIDMVMNVGMLKVGDEIAVKYDIQQVVRKAAYYGAKVKVILETCLLTEEEIVKACLLAKEAGAAYVKTSTGFSRGGATAEHVKLMRKTVGPEMGVKASGGIRDYETAMAMINAGADRIGASASVQIVEEWKAKGQSCDSGDQN